MVIRIDDTRLHDEPENSPSLNHVRDSTPFKTAEKHISSEKGIRINTTKRTTRIWGPKGALDVT